MLQVLPYVAEQASIAVLGKHNVPDGVPVLTFLEAAQILRKPLPDGRYRVFHARRNDEMIQALILKYFFRSKIKIIFTSTAQRKKTWLTRWLMSQMDGLLSTCNAAAQFMPEPPDRIIPHGVDLSFFNDRPKKNLVSVDLPTKYSIGLFGRVRAQKGVDLLIDAALELLTDFREWGVVVVGEITSDQKSFYEEQVAKLHKAGLGQRVLFTGKVSFDALPYYFQSIDIGCALSINEGFGLTVLEVGACGKPVVATRAGAWPDILSDSDAGLLINVGDKVALISALRQLMTNDEDRRRRGSIARELVERNYTVQREANSLLEYYRFISVESLPEK